MTDMIRGSDLLAATRLVRGGRLAEATSLLQSLLAGRAGHSDAARPDPDGDVIDLPSERVEEARPREASPEVPEPEPGPDRRADLASRWRARAARPDPLQRLIDRFRTSGLDGGMEALADLGALKAPVGEPLPDGASFLAESYRNDAGSRAYKLYVPSTHRGRTVPLVVMLHGCTQSPDDFAAGTQMNRLAEEHGLLVVYPAQSTAANPNKCWNWFKPEDQRRDGGEPALIAGITRQVMAQWPVDPRRVYVAGLSAGGAAAAIMAATYPDLYAAVGVHSGLPVGAAKDMPSAFAAMQGGGMAASRATTANAGGGGRLVPTIVFHGDEDRTVHAGNADRIIEQARGAGSSDAVVTTGARRGRSAGGRSYRCIEHADAAGRAVLEQWVIQGAGHAWAGGSASGSYTDPDGPDASREMLRFFLEHTHPAPDFLHHAHPAQGAGPVG